MLWKVFAPRYDDDDVVLGAPNARQSQSDLHLIPSNRVLFCGGALLTADVFVLLSLCFLQRVCTAVRAIDRVVVDWVNGNQ